MPTGLPAFSISFAAAARHFSGMNFTVAREKMVREQLQGPGRLFRHAGVLAAMAEVPRHEFVPEAEQSSAYADRALPIGFGQTISQPYIVALMTELLDPRPTDRVLEVGTGSGYQAAVLSRLVAAVFTSEILAPLAQRAAAVLRRLGYDNVQVRFGDASGGWPEEAPFDAIIVTCAPDHVPPALVGQLQEGGRMVIPTGGLDEQELYRLEKHRGRIIRQAVLPVRFVPMAGEAGAGLL